MLVLVPDGILHTSTCQGQATRVIQSEMISSDYMSLRLDDV